MQDVDVIAESVLAWSNPASRRPHEVPECAGPDPSELWLDDDPHPRTMGDVVQGVLGLGVISLAIGFWWFAARLIESGLPPWLRFLSARRKLCSSF
mmetsp:Transcript_126322/g.404399  ORF Transcript_126322/g.404399 Transcript_126322/m.404399 type:complete len:96 (+) Transcript_126322:395-682(+)